MPRRKPTARPKTTGDGPSQGGSIQSGSRDDVGQTAGQLAGDTVTEAGSTNAAEPTPTAFDVFVERGLHAIYDGVLAEPIPDELLRLIEDDRRKE